MLQMLHYRLKITLQDGRTLTGQMIAFDRHMNLVLADTEEYRQSKRTNNKAPVEEKRVLGLIIIRGEHVVSLCAVAPPPAGEGPKRTAAGSMQARMMPFAPPGIGRPAGRGMPISIGQLL